MSVYMINLNHPCDMVNLWKCDTEEEVDIAYRQGYLELDDVRSVMKEEMERRRTKDI